MNLERNVGRKDKNIRIAIGIVLIILALFTKSALLALLGIIALGTGIFSFCGLYKLMGMNTATAEEQKAASSDLEKRAQDNLSDFKEEVVETINDLKKKN